MTRLKQQYESDGFYGIGVFNSSDEHNIGTLWRSAYILGAAFIFTINCKYKKQSSDVTRAWSKIPLYHYSDFDVFKESIPYATSIVAVEMAERAELLVDFEHPQRAVYLLGNEASGIPPGVLDECPYATVLPGAYSLNVAVAGSLVLYDRVAKVPTSLPRRPA